MISSQDLECSVGPYMDYDSADGFATRIVTQHRQTDIHRKVGIINNERKSWNNRVSYMFQPQNTKIIITIQLQILNKIIRLRISAVNLNIAVGMWSHISKRRCKNSNRKYNGPQSTNCSKDNKINDDQHQQFRPTTQSSRNSLTSNGLTHTKLTVEQLP